MKHLIKLGMALLIVAIVLGMGACKFEDDETGNTSKSGVDFKNYTTKEDVAIYVNNTTSQRLVAFKGSLHSSNLIGGVPGKSGTHGFKKTNVFPTTPIDFPMIFITEKDYTDYKSDLSSLEDKPFTRVYVFYNSQGDNDVVYEISSNLGGTQTVRLINNTNYNVELRVNGIAGQTLGYASKDMTQTDLKVTPGQYMLYPVFKYFNAARNTMGTIYPKGGSNAYYVYTFIANNPNQIVQLNLSNALAASTAGKSLGAAWLIVYNGTSQAIEVTNGITLITDTMGFSYFNPSETKTMQINMPSAGGSNNFAPQLQISGYQAGVAGKYADIVTSDTGSKTFTVEADKQYVVSVSGDINSAEGLTAVLDMTSVTTIDFDDFIESATN